MFSLLFAIWEWIFKKEERKLILIGLDNAGKSTTLEVLRKHFTGKGMDLDKIPPTIGLNIARFQVDGIIAVCWDVGGQLNLRQLWSNYFNEVDGIIFVIDSSDTGRFPEAREALKTALDHSSLKGKPLLIMANKADIPGASTTEQISPSMGVEQIESRPLKLISCSAKENTNMEPGIRWMVQQAVEFRKINNLDS